MWGCCWRVLRMRATSDMAVGASERFKGSPEQPGESYWACANKSKVMDPKELCQGRGSADRCINPRNTCSFVSSCRETGLILHTSLWPRLFLWWDDWCGYLSPCFCLQKDCWVHFSNTWVGGGKNPSVNPDKLLNECAIWLWLDVCTCS